VHGGRVDEILLSRNVTSGQVAYHHYDARGHAILLTNSSGGITEQYEYDAFGQPYFFNSTAQPLNSSTFGNRFLFTGREYLSELKLFDYRKRMYQPELGRFLQPDPKHFLAGDYNLYRYCHNDPVNKSDPLGLKWAFVDKQGKFDPGLKRDFEKARAALSAKNTEAKGIFDRIANDTKHTVTVVRSTSFGRNVDQFTGKANGNASFAWNPSAASAFANGSQSPATVLLHEAAHADAFIANPTATANAFRAGDGSRGQPGRFGSIEERRVITGPEARAAASMNEDSRDSAAAVFYPVDSILGR
jgi:RHS repeat-associated protein